MYTDPTTAVYIPGGNPATMNVVLSSSTTPGSFAPYAPGDLGRTFSFGGKRWMMVQVESGATALATGQVLLWKNRGTKTVTNVVANAVNGGTTNAWRNQVAGIYQGSALTPGSYGNLICILIEGTAITLLASAGAVGTLLIADVAANVGQALGVTVGTAPGYVCFGTVTTAVSGGAAVADISFSGVL